MKCEISKIVKFKDAAALHGLPAFQSQSPLLEKLFSYFFFFYFMFISCVFLIIFLLWFYLRAPLSLITLAAAAVAAGYSSPSPAAASSSSELRMNVSFSAQAQVSQLKVKLFLLSDKSPSTWLDYTDTRKAAHAKEFRIPPFERETRLEWALEVLCMIV